MSPHCKKLRGHVASVPPRVAPWFFVVPFPPTTDFIHNSILKFSSKTSHNDVGVLCRVNIWSTRACVTVDAVMSRIAHCRAQRTVSQESSLGQFGTETDDLD